MNKKLSAEFCFKNKVIILGSGESTVVLGITEPLEDELRARLERYFLPEHNIEYRIITKGEYEVLIARLFSGTGDIVKNSGEEQNDDITNASKAAPVVNLLNSIVSEAIIKQASDIHIENQEEKTRIRYRKDGKLLQMLSVEKEKGAALTGRIKLLSELNILEHRRCLDGRFEYMHGGFSYDIRVSVIPGIEGESAVLRILGGNIKAPELETLGFTKPQLTLINKMMSLEYGLVLVTGPTGSGKTTTLASILTRLNKDDIQIITVEDPVEYRIKGALQISVDEELGRTFFEILKRVLRHDPDILMVGEIRDEQTAAMACRMALTGHLVFASVHTNSCEETPLRLVDMGVPSYIVSAVLRGVISQRLVEKREGGRTVKADIKFFEKEREVRNLCLNVS